MERLEPDWLVFFKQGNVQYEAKDETGARPNSSRGTGHARGPLDDGRRSQCGWALGQVRTVCVLMHHSCLMAELMDKIHWLSKEAPPLTTVTIPAR